VEIQIGAAKFGWWRRRREAKERIERDADALTANAGPDAWKTARWWALDVTIAAERDHWNLVYYLIRRRTGRSGRAETATRAAKDAFR
jgi:hypothetical protein